MQTIVRVMGSALLLLVVLLATPRSLAQAATVPPADAPVEASYADLADLSNSASVVVRVQVRKLTRVEDERAPGLRPGYGRFYIQARTQSLLIGNSVLGESLVYLVDLPLDAREKPPRLKKEEVILFAEPAPQRPGELRLVSPYAQLRWTEALEARVRGILTEFAASDAPPQVITVREILYVPAGLAGEGETQIFLSTADRSAASITVRHSPGRPPAWGASFSELLADVGNPPRRDTLAWYRLACFLPERLPPGANLSDTGTSSFQARADYRMVLEALGPCPRNL